MPTDAVGEHPIDHPSEHLVQDLTTAVEGALWAYDPIRQTDSRLGVRVENGVAHLAGNVRSDMMKGVASRLASNVPGIQRVENELVTDTEIESRAALQIAMDPEAGLLTDHLVLKSLIGTVYLGGTAAAADLAQAEAIRARTEVLVRSLLGVHEVINDLRAVVGTGGDTLSEEAEDGAPSGPSAADEKIQDRMRIWRERAAARGT